jgi:hypothetical protein
MKMVVVCGGGNWLWRLVMVVEVVVYGGYGGLWWLLDVEDEVS